MTNSRRARLVAQPERATNPPSQSLAHSAGTAMLRRPFVPGLLLAVATFLVYYPVHHHPFALFDDRDYVYENPVVSSGISWPAIQWAFTTTAAANWHPLTWLSHELDCQLFQLNPAGHHDVNVVFHVVDALLLFWVLLRATKLTGRSFMVAALFALHPINVESVAWVAERKNVLSMMFFLLALAAYRWYARQPGSGRYILVALLFAIGLMAKPQIITLPFVLLLWDYWPLQRMFPGNQTKSDLANGIPGKSLSSLVLEKLPLLAIVAASAVITLTVQRPARSIFPRTIRLGNAILSYGLYLKKAIWPARLALFYPHPGSALNWYQVTVSGALLLAITLLVILGRRHRYLPVGWFWFLGTLIPMLGIIQVGSQAMADRYAYASLIGLFIMLCWGVAELGERAHSPRLLIPALSCAILLALAVVARNQVNLWQSEESLWGNSLAVTSPNALAETQLGRALAIAGKIQEAVPHFYRAIAMNPDDANSHMGIAIYDMQQRNYRDAILHYQQTVKDKRERRALLIQAYLGMAKAYNALGDQENARLSLQAAKALQSQ